MVQAISAPKQVVMQYQQQPKIVIVTVGGSSNDNSPQSGFVSNPPQQKTNYIVELIKAGFSMAAIVAIASAFTNAGRNFIHKRVTGFTSRPLSEWHSVLSQHLDNLFKFATNPSSNVRVNFRDLKLSDFADKEKLKGMYAQATQSLKDQFSAVFGTYGKTLADWSLQSSISRHPYGELSSFIDHGLQVAGNDRQLLEKFATDLSLKLAAMRLNNTLGNENIPRWSKNTMIDRFASSVETAQDYVKGKSEDVERTKGKLLEFANELHTIASSDVMTQVTSQTSAEVVSEKINQGSGLNLTPTQFNEFFIKLFRGEIKPQDIGAKAQEFVESLGNLIPADKKEWVQDFLSRSSASLITKPNLVQ